MLDKPSEIEKAITYSLTAVVMMIVTVLVAIGVVIFLALPQPTEQSPAQSTSYSAPDPCGLHEVECKK